jgi:hypothetical protein
MKLSNLFQDEQANLQLFMQDWKYIIYSTYLQQFEDITLDNVNCSLVTEETGLHIQLKLDIGTHGSVTLQSYPIKPNSKTLSELQSLVRSGRYRLLSYPNTHFLECTVNVWKPKGLYSQHWTVQMGLLTSDLKEISPNSLPGFLVTSLLSLTTKEQA